MGHQDSKALKVTFRCKILEAIKTMDSREKTQTVLQLLATRRQTA